MLLPNKHHTKNSENDISVALLIQQFTVLFKTMLIITIILFLTQKDITHTAGIIKQNKMLYSIMYMYFLHQK